ADVGGARLPLPVWHRLRAPRLPHGHGRGRRRARRHVVRQGDHVLLPVRSGHAAVCPVRGGLHARGRRTRVSRLGRSSDRALAKGDSDEEARPARASGQSRGRSAAGRGSMHDLMRRLLWLPVQASTLSTRIDYLHYFVITVTMIASIATGLLAFVLLFKYRERRRAQSTPLVMPSVKFEIVV